MKRIILFLFFTSSALTQVNAQGTGGFFNQQSSKAKLMVQQIAYLEVYLHEMKTGYSIAQKGLNTAHELKNGTYSLHTDYLNSLQQVNLVILNNPKGKAIADMLQQIIRSFTTEITWQQKEKLFTAKEISYLQHVYDHLLKSSNQDMDELVNVLTPGKLQLTDQQRLDRLDRLYDSMKDKNAFAGSFTGKCRKVALSRKHAAEDQSQMKKLYGIQ
jgi:ribonuclease HI